MESTGHDQQQPVKRPRFWVGPFIAGCCFALGYGITQRVITLQSNAEKPKPEAFSPALFPGESLEGLRGRNGQSSDLQVDLAALEARLEAERKRKEEAEKLADQELQATGTDPVPPAQPAWTEPALPALDLDPPVAAPPAAPNPPVQPAVVAEPEAPPPPAPADQTPLAPPPPIPPPPPAPLPAQP